MNRVLPGTWFSVPVVLLLLFVACESGETTRSGAEPSTTRTTADEGVKDREKPDVTLRRSSTTSSTQAASAEPSTSALLKVVGDVNIPEGDPGKLSVVAVGQPAEGFGTVPVVVRNRTNESVRALTVSGSARSSDGRLVGSGSSRGMAPAKVGPGEWAIGYVFFSADLPPDASYDLSAAGRRGSDESRDLIVEEVEVVEGVAGSLEVVGIVANPTSRDVVDRIPVMAMCFEGDTPVEARGGGVDANEVVANGTASFSVAGFATSCSSVAVGVIGHRS